MSNVIAIPKAKGFDPHEQRPTVLNDEIITNNGFFPDVLLSDIRNAMRIDGTVTNDRLKHSAIEAMQTVNRDLKVFRQNQQFLGIEMLEDCDSEEINGQSELVYLYLRAVYCLTAANLYERYRSFDSTKDGERKAQELEQTAGDLRRDYHFAVRDILGEKRMTAELV